MSGYIGGILILSQPEIKEQDNNIKRHGKNAFRNE